ncbi:hypothetical protein Afil01_29980 [Actinorhabdospora filicis]|uniref:Uncharacterized protein n=1 Tax=Actinorhabdospora filicis TaxID=1785913 RepID=A0A9W6SP65_9ACTN|nr:hypothetical protein Afil01_29980 [Actinorhabdospora filicis]
MADLTEDSSGATKTRLLQRIRTERPDLTEVDPCNPQVSRSDCCNDHCILTPADWPVRWPPLSKRLNASQTVPPVSMWRPCTTPQAIGGLDPPGYLTEHFTALRDFHTDATRPGLFILARWD